jgi:hypothetical protein
MAQHRIRNLLLAGTAFLAACAPLAEQAAEPLVPTDDPNPIALDEAGSIDDLGEEPQSGEIALPTFTVTDDIELPATVITTTETTATQEEYIPASYADYATGGRGLPVPANLPADVEADFRAFYRHLHVEQREFTNADGTIGQGIAFSPSNYAVNIRLALDGHTWFADGDALNADPNFGNNEMRYLFVWDSESGDTISVRAPNEYGDITVFGFGSYATTGPDGIRNYDAGSNSWVESSPVEPTATATIVPTAVPTAAPTITPVPSSTVTAPQATIGAPLATAEIISDGMSRYTYQNSEGARFSALVPSEFMAVLDIAQLDVEGDTAFLGNMPLFFRNGATWVVNPGVKQETYYQGSPALVLSTSTHNNTEARSMLNVSEVHSIQDEAWTGGYRMVSVDPAGIEKVVFELVQVRTSSGVSQVERAAVSLVYFNEADALTTAWFHVYDGALSINNTEGRPISDLLEIVDEPVKMFFFANFSNEDDRYELVGVPLADVPSTDVVNQINNGGHISVGWPLTINTSK